jgi:hypothetical protein
MLTATHVRSKTIPVVAAASNSSSSSNQDYLQLSSTWATISCFKSIFDVQYLPYDLLPPAHER